MGARKGIFGPEREACTERGRREGVPAAKACPRDAVTADGIAAESFAVESEDDRPRKSSVPDQIPPFVSSLQISFGTCERGVLRALNFFPKVPLYILLLLRYIYCCHRC